MSKGVKKQNNFKRLFFVRKMRYVFWDVGTNFLGTAYYVDSFYV